MDGALDVALDGLFGFGEVVWIAFLDRLVYLLLAGSFLFLFLFLFCFVFVVVVDDVCLFVVG